MRTLAEDELARRMGRRLREIREARRLTLVAVARNLGITYQQLRKYEAGDNRISASMLYRLSGILALDLGRFFAEVGVSNRGDPLAVPLPPSTAAGIREDLLRIADPVVRQRLDDLLVSIGILRAPEPE